MYLYFPRAPLEIVAFNISWKSLPRLKLFHTSKETTQNYLMVWNVENDRKKVIQGSHLFLLTKFPDFSSIFFIFPWLLLNIFIAFIQYL